MPDDRGRDPGRHDPGRDELHDLLGAYALDAVDDDERAAIERLLETDPRARGEVESFRETAALLAHAGSDAPAGLWDRIADAMEEPPPRLRMPGVRAAEPPEEPRGAWTGGRSRRRSGANHEGVRAAEPPEEPCGAWTGGRSRRRSGANRHLANRWVAIGAAVAAAIIAVLGVQVARQSSRIDRVDRELAAAGPKLAARNAARAPGARTIALRARDGHTVGRVVSLPDGTGYFLGDSLATLPTGRTYQLWALIGDAKQPAVVSAGVLGPDVGTAPFRVGGGSVLGFAITDEQAPGVAVTHQPTLAEGTVHA